MGLLELGLMTRMRTCLLPLVVAGVDMSVSEELKRSRWGAFFEVDMVLSLEVFWDFAPMISLVMMKYADTRTKPVAADIVGLRYEMAERGEAGGEREGNGETKEKYMEGQKHDDDGRVYACRSRPKRQLIIRIE